MTGYLTAAVAIVGMLCLLNLILMFGVIRRLREHTRLLGNLPPGMSNPLGIQVGETPGDFTASCVRGETLSRADLTGPVLVGFFSPGCEPCATELPHFAERGRAMRAGGQHALGVIVDGADGAGSEYRKHLDPVAQVVVERHGGPMQSAFKVAAYPTIFLLGEDGTVVARGTMTSDLGNAAASDVAAV